MTTFDDYVAGLDEDDFAELERLNDAVSAAARMPPGPDTERVLEALHADATAIDSALHMVYSRMVHVMSLFDRGATADAFRLFVPMMALFEERRHEIWDDFAETLATIVLKPLDVMIDDPEVPRGAIEAFLDQLESEVRRTGQGDVNLAVARAYWFSHVGEREACEEWTDRWLTDGSEFWSHRKTTTIGLLGAVLAAFDEHEALEHLDLRTPDMIGRPYAVTSILVERAGLQAICGRPEDGWAGLAGVLEEEGLEAVAASAPVASLVRAADHAPLDAASATVPGARAIVEAATEHVGSGTIDAVADTAALARFHLLRGSGSTGLRLAGEARDLARAYDARNGTGQHAALLECRWFADV